MKDGGDQREEFVQWYTQLSFRVGSGMCMRLSSSGGFYVMDSILLVHILTSRPTGSTVSHLSNPAEGIWGILVPEPIPSCFIVVLRIV